MSARSCHFCHLLSTVRELPNDQIVWKFPHSVALLGPWQFYHGYCILIARTHATELHQLADAERQAYFEEMCLLARAIEEAVRPQKLNYELLGNQAPHLHWHIFPRFVTDPEHLKPVWIALDRADNDPAERQRLQNGAMSRHSTIMQLRTMLSGNVTIARL